MHANAYAWLKSVADYPLTDFALTCVNTVLTDCTLEAQSGFRTSYRQPASVSGISYANFTSGGDLCLSKLVLVIGRVSESPRDDFVRKFAQPMVLSPGADKATAGVDDG